VASDSTTRFDFDWGSTGLNCWPYAGRPSIAVNRGRPRRLSDFIGGLAIARGILNKNPASFKYFLTYT
jgi:hypothetical protein